MSQYAEIEFERRVAETIEQLDYKVTTEPMQRSGHRTWQDRISSWFMAPSHSLPGPDMSVADGEKVALVEAKAYPILLGPVIQARRYADYFEAPVIICVPDDAFQQIPYSVRDWAEANAVIVSPIGEIGASLKKALRG